MARIFTVGLETTPVATEAVVFTFEGPYAGADDHMAVGTGSIGP